MVDTEEVKRLLREIKGNVSWLVIKHSQEPHRLKIERDIRAALALLENMEEGERIALLESRLCVLCMEVPWSMGQMKRCDECSYIKQKPPAEVPLSEKLHVAHPKCACILCIEEDE